MHKLPLSLTALSLLCASIAQAEETASKGLEASSKTLSPLKEPSNTTKTAKFEAFTGKVIKNKVRVRLQPTFDASVWKELNRDDMIVVTGEADDFYVVQPPSNTKAYVFRTFILDNVVEGNRVNVRLKPDLEAPVIAQLNSGDRVNGTVVTSNSKWLEIDLPASTRFYISKDYLEKVGDAGYLARLEKKKEEGLRLLKTTETISQLEMQKEFSQINIEGVVANYKKILSDYSEFPEMASEAKTKLAALQEDFTRKKIAYLETQAEAAQAAKNLENKNKQLAQELQAHKKKITTLEKQIQRGDAITLSEPTPAPSPRTLPLHMSVWIPAEQEAYKKWSWDNPNQDQMAFYQDQQKHSFIVKGVVEPYNRPVKNKPGDFMLVSATNRLPVAFMYSTQVNLQDYVGHEVTFRVNERPNNNYAFPAYFVLSVE